MHFRLLGEIRSEGNDEAQQRGYARKIWRVHSTCWYKIWKPVYRVHSLKFKGGRGKDSEEGRLF